MCIIVDCTTEIIKARGLCSAHYEQFRKNGTLSYYQKVRTQGQNTKKCDVDGCEKQTKMQKYCPMHYYRVQKYGEPEPKVLKRKAHGNSDWITHHGYRMVYSERHGKAIMQHRKVMEEHLGRKLLPEENVHHKNGERLDNRLENLELWSRSQPPGQRVEDKIAWAKELLRLYNVEQD